MFNHFLFCIISGWSSRRSIRSSCLPRSWSNQLLANVKTSPLCPIQITLNHIRIVVVRITAMGRQLFTHIRFHIRIFIVLRFFALRFVRSLRSAKKDCFNLGLFDIRWRTIHLFDFIVLHNPGIWLWDLFVHQLSTVNARFLRIPKYQLYERRTCSMTKDYTVTNRKFTDGFYNNNNIVENDACWPTEIFHWQKQSIDHWIHLIVNF